MVGIRVELGYRASLMGLKSFFDSLYLVAHLLISLLVAFWAVEKVNVIHMMGCLDLILRIWMPVEKCIAIHRLFGSLFF